MKFTKKIIGAVLLSVIGFTLFAEEIKEKAYLEVEIDGKIQGKWCDFYGLDEYDRNGNLIHEKSSYGYEFWYEYDKNGKKVHTKNSAGDEWWLEYDKNGNMIHEKNSDGKEWWHEYDKNGKKVHGKNSAGHEWWYEYDKNGNVIQKTYNAGPIYIYIYILEYWDDGKTLKRKITYSLLWKIKCMY